MLPMSSGLLFGFIAITIHAVVAMFMHQLGVPQPMQAAPAWRSASRKAESRLSRTTMEVPTVGRKAEVLDESAHARERDDFAALRKDMRQLISRLSQHLDLVEQPKAAVRAAAAETPAKVVREPEPVHSAGVVAATQRTDKVGLTLAQAVQAMAHDAILAEDAARTGDEAERSAAAAATRLLKARLARAKAEARQLEELQARASAELQEAEAEAEVADRRLISALGTERAAGGGAALWGSTEAAAAARAAGGAADGEDIRRGAASAAGTTLEQLLETLRAQRPAASPKPLPAAAAPATAQPTAAKPLPAKPAAAAPRRKPKKAKETSNWEEEWEKEDREASSHTSLTEEVQAMLAKLMSGGGGGGGSSSESKAGAKKKKGKATLGHPRPQAHDRPEGAQTAKGHAASHARADKDDFEVHDLD